MCLDCRSLNIITDRHTDIIPTTTHLDAGDFNMDISPNNFTSIFDQLPSLLNITKVKDNMYKAF